MSEDDQEVSFRHFFLSSIHSRLPTTSSAERYDLVHAEVGTSKEKLDKIDLDLPLVPVVDTFGRFVKYSVCVCVEESATTTARNAFDVLMASQQALQSSETALPKLLTERNNKDKLYNDVLRLLQSKALRLRHDEVNSFGTRLVKALRDALWHIDGHHTAFAQRSTSLPCRCFQVLQWLQLPSKDEAQEA